MNPSIILPGWSDFAALAAPLILVLGGSLLILLEVAGRNGRRAHMPWITVITAVAAAYFAWRQGAGEARVLFNGAAMADGFGSFIAVTVAIALALGALVGSGYMRERGIERGEYYGLMCFATSGMVLLAMATDLLTMFVSLEVMSIATYALVAFRRDAARSSEAALKYLILGALSSAIFLYGAALLFAATGEIRLAALGQAAAAQPGTLFFAGAAMAAVGFAFKVAAVPFHMWTPDVYEGAPTPVTAFMAAGVKAAAFAALVRLLLMGLGSEALATANLGWGQVVYALALLTVIAGNLLALVQDNVKRILAYSSIAHAGYALLAVTASAWAGYPVSSAVLFYLFVYAVTALGAFAVVAAVERHAPVGGVAVGHIDELSGLGRRRPGLALAMTIFMFSLAGVPPTGGFMAKLEVFRALFAAGTAAPGARTALYTLGVIGVLFSVAGVYYYLRVVVWMYMRPAPEGVREGPRWFDLRAGVAAAAVGVLLLGVLPGPVSAWAQRAVQTAFGPAPVAHLADTAE